MTYSVLVMKVVAEYDTRIGVSDSHFAGARSNKIPRLDAANDLAI